MAVIIIFPFNLTRSQYGLILLLKMIININYNNGCDAYAVS